MTQAVYNILEDRHFSEIIDGQWPPVFLSVFKNLQQTSNHVLRKNKNTDSIEGVRYLITTEPSTLRPVKSWSIRIETWSCKPNGAIQTEDILGVRIANMHHPKPHQDYIRDVTLGGCSLDINEDNISGAMMALAIFISKIDAGRMPNIEQILSLYNL